jgi:hypothetical protein
VYNYRLELKLCKIFSSIITHTIIVFKFGTEVVVGMRQITPYYEGDPWYRCIPKAEKKEGRDHMLNIPKNGKGPCRVSQ